MIILMTKPICKKLIVIVCNAVPVGLLSKTEVKAEYESIKNKIRRHPKKIAAVFTKEVFIWILSVSKINGALFNKAKEM